MEGPAYAYICDGNHRMLLTYRGVHSCVPPCPLCGSVMHCVNEDPKCACGGHYYIDKHGRPYCPKNDQHNIPDAWAFELTTQPDAEPKP